ncbi:hypothetical protein DF3PB_3020005 [uncultured Defluviicoccus sp.]|uniref:Uncharacterized protein n=1 Tax=metagenome TaxID=256318 RepID=A0A380TDR9_9ZZZZ|nr:hypothetical protein DF3PB_3020005 [uncultured Defluviicoccus sp.]
MFLYRTRQTQWAARTCKDYSGFLLPFSDPARHFAIGENASVACIGETPRDHPFKCQRTQDVVVARIVRLGVDDLSHFFLYAPRLILRSLFAGASPFVPPIAAARTAVYCNRVLVCFPQKILAPPFRSAISPPFRAGALSFVSVERAISGLQRGCP